MKILGLSALRHDSAAALIEDGRIVAAAQEERFSRKKHDGGFPAQAMAYCLGEAGCGLADLDLVMVHGAQSAELTALLPVPHLHFTHALLSHAASAFFPSPFPDAALLVLDEATGLGHGSGSSLRIHKEIPHSLGHFYSAITRYLGFKANSGEYKVMGLAPYGQPLYARTMLDHLIAVAEDGGFRLGALDGLPALFGQPARRPGQEILSQFHMDMAASVQAVTEQVTLGLARALAKETGARALCLGGGAALNCVANGKILRSGLFEKIWVQPAAGEAGGALGAALLGYHQHQGGPRSGHDAMQGGFLGPAFSQEDIQARLTALGAKFSILSEDEMITATAQALADGQAVGWMQGRMEFGPRALGGRSILGDPRLPHMQQALNSEVKFREAFRPFAPSVLREDAGRYFQLNGDSPYMLLVAPVVHGASIPAVTHVDGSARIQTVHGETNGRYHALISAFKARTGCGVLVNTSFNVRGEPMICTPEDAFRCFMGSHIQALALGNCFLRKEDQSPGLRLDERIFEPD